MDTTKQLPAPRELAPPRLRRWPAPLFGGIAEVLTRLADVCLHPLIILPLFFAVSSDTNVEIGRAVALILAAGALAGAVTSPLAGDRWPKLRLLTLVVVTGAQALLLLGLARAGDWLTTNHAGLASGPLVVLIAAAACGGCAGIMRLGAARIVRAEGSWRTRWGRWTVLGIIGTLAGGYLARRELVRTAGAFPEGYTRLFAIAGFATLAACAVLALVLVLEWRERGPLAPGRPELLVVPELLSNNLAYGRFVFFRVLYACGALADPFYIIYATRELGAGVRAAAAYLVTLVVARAVTTLAWRALSIGSGNPMVLQLATFVRLLAPITALTLPPLLGSATLRDRIPGGDTTNLVAFGIVFAAWGAASAGLDLAAPAIQSALTTPRERGAAHFVTGVALAITTLALPLGGLIADRLGFSFLFIAALVIGLGTLLAGGLIDEPGVFVLRPAPNERPVLRRRSARREG
jgi:hypothetical protein